MRKKDLVQLIITGVLVLVLIFIWASASKKPLRRNSGGGLPQATISSAVLVNQGHKLSSNNLYNTLEQESKSIELKRDPFTAAAIISEKSLNSEISLTGILWDKVKPLAIINGNVVKKGQSLGNKTVIEIKPDRVILSDGQILSELRLKR